MRRSPIALCATLIALPAAAATPPPPPAAKTITDLRGCRALTDLPRLKALVRLAATCPDLAAFAAQL